MGRDARERKGTRERRRAGEAQSEGGRAAQDAAEKEVRQLELENIGARDTLWLPDVVTWSRARPGTCNTFVCFRGSRDTAHLQTPSPSQR